MGGDHSNRCRSKRPVADDFDIFVGLGAVRDRSSYGNGITYIYVFINGDD